MKKILEHFIKKKNPDFYFDSKVSFRTLFFLFLDKGVYLLRGMLYNLIRLKTPKILFLGRGVKICNSNNITFGKWIRIEAGACINGLGRKGLDIGNSVSIGAYSQIIVSSSYNNLGEYIRIGDNVGIGQFSSIGGSGGVIIGKDCIIGQYFSCHPENHIFDSLLEPIRKQGTIRSGIEIGENCWIGAKVTILAGVSIGSDCVIAAGAVVTKSMPAKSIIGGVPARIIKARI